RALAKESGERFQAVFAGSRVERAVGREAEGIERMAADALQEFMGNVALDLQRARLAIAEPRIAQEQRNDLLVPLKPVQVQAVGRDSDRRVAVLRAANPLEALERAVAPTFEVERAVCVLHRPGRVRAARLKRGTAAVHGPAAVDRPAARRRELAPTHENR